MAALHATPTCQTCGTRLTNSRPGKPRSFCSLKCANTSKPFEERVWEKIQKAGPDDCWPWIGHFSPKGYGRILRWRDGAKHVDMAHRVAWELVNGPIPPGLCCCHRCDNPPCCNPAHIFLGTKDDNRRDAVAKSRQSRGETHGTAKLTDVAVRDIRARCSNGESRLALATEYGVTKATVKRIVVRQAWAHID